MNTKIKIKWSTGYENDILPLARNNDDYLNMQQGIYMYVTDEMDENTGDRFPRPLYIASLSDDMSCANIKDKLLQNIGRFEMQESMRNESDKMVSIIVGRVYKDDDEPVTGHMLDDLCSQLINDFKPNCNEMKDESPSEDFHFSYEIEHSINYLPKQLELQSDAA